ncbi:hypothetical protein ARAM_002963 [Aspergillus rambellii]|uniref:THO complex subunit 2 n=1 Tax=Aspergillus rambellii TaxID=308745 RepID=A0A0F8XAH1_9EURO|nr:hypothetical protein ARAM_002963 [Aspergillus rambellii]
MAPGAGGKRKKAERPWSADSGNDGPRPSPHRPGNLNMAQQNHGSHSPQSRDNSDARGRLRRQPSRGGRHSNAGRRPSNDSQNFPGGRVDAAMSPPSTPAARDGSDQVQMNGIASMTPQLQPTQSQSQGPSQAKHQPTPTPQSRMSPTVPVHVPPAGPPPSYHYKYVSSDMIDDWKATGKQRLVAEGMQARDGQDMIVLASIYQELIRCGLDGRLPPEEAGLTVKEIIGEEVSAEYIHIEGQDQPSAPLDTRSLFLDTLSIVTDSDTSNFALRPLVFSTGINPTLMRLQLETPLLQSLGLVRDTFARMGIRKQTNLLYRQSNYNLLREESEGYSKLLTELFATSNNEPPSSEVVEDTFERVKAMIGAFDMDVGRVLDVTLDVFAAVLVKQYRFFVKLLRASSWWPKEHILHTIVGGPCDSGLPNWALPGSSGWVTTDEERADALHANAQRDRDFWDRIRQIGIRGFFEIGRQPVSAKELNQLFPETSSLSGEEADTRKWIEETGTLPPKGSQVAAQLLGFKLRFYSSQARSKSDILPYNLIYLAALLIKVGFISLRDLYPHLWRPDDSMDALKEEKLKEKAERERAARPGGGVNALMMAGALSDDTLPIPRIRESEARSLTPGKDQEADKSAAAKPEENELPEPSDQKVLLLKSLLAIGALPESLFILSKFPWLMDNYPELPEYIHRILHHCLSKIYASLRPLPPVEALREQKQIPSHDQAGVPKGHIRLAQAPPRRVLRWAQLDKEDTNDGTDYRFYWDDWADNIPICQSVDDVFALCSSFLNLSGHKIGQDPSLLTKLARIGKDSLVKDDSPENKARWQDLCKRLLVPAISLTKANPGVVNEIFDLISFFPRETRYNMYAEWYFGQTSRLPDIKSAFDQARAETKDVLKRLSKTNIRPMARALAKIAYANPGIVINVAISQIESYENLIEVVVECARYFTYLGYDILTWSLINSLGQKGRSRVQEGGLLTSRWLNALATFAGRTFKRYSVMDPAPLLQYVVEQLRQNNSTDLIVLEQMISSMAGIITDTNFNDAQIQAMAGGDILQSQTILQLLDKRHESKTTSKRLIKSLTVSRLAGQLLIAIAQERLTCIFKESEASSELKLLGNIFDEIHRILAQYLDLLRSNLSVDEFDSFVPDLASLIRDFGIQPEVAFWIRRPSVAQRLSDLDKSSQDIVSAAKVKEIDEVPALKAEVEKIETNDGEVEPLAASQMDIDQEEPDKLVDAGAQALEQKLTGPALSDSPPLNPVMQDLQDQVKSVLPSETWGAVGLPFYVAFWQLSLYDVHIPQKSYEDEIDRLKKKVIAIGNDRSDISVAGTQRKEREKKQITQLQDRILDENKAHLKSYGQTRARLQKEKDRWFVGMRGKHDSLHIALLEQCFLPRLLLSPIDAFYCFKMLKFLHTTGAPNFRTVGLLDQLFREHRLTALIFQSTSREADNLGRLLNEVLRDLSRWHADKNVYEKEAFGNKKDLPGFAMTVDPEGKPTTFLEYEDFRRLLYKWHRLLSSALKICLNGGEYMHIRNAISVLKAIVQHFPAVNWIGRDMLTSVNNLSQNDERDDVKIPAASLIGDLNRREKKWMLPQAFMITSQPASGKGNQNDKTGAKTSISRPQSATPTQLNATVPEFKPMGAPGSKGAVQSETTSKQEVEDGEIEDAKMADALAKDTDDNQQNAQNPAEHDAQQTDKPTNKTSADEGRPANSQDPTTGEASTDKLAAENRTGEDVPSQSRPSPSPAGPQATPKAPDSRRAANTPKHSDQARAPGGARASRSQPHSASTSHLDDRRLPPRPDLLDERRDRHSEYPRGGRFNSEHDFGRSFDQPIGDGRNFGRLDRDYPLRPPADEPFRGPSYRDWPDRSGRLRVPDIRENLPTRPAGPQTHPDRADLIHDISDRPGDGFRRGESQRQERDDRRTLPTRGASPQRIELPNRPERFPSDDRRSGNFNPQPARGEDLPTGPRSDRLPRTSMEAPEPREPIPDIPSGPRSRNPSGRGGRNQPAHAPAGSSGSGPALPERAPPTGPGRQGLRNDQPTSATPPSPRSDKLEASGIHPDRLKALQQPSLDNSFGSGMRSHPPPPPAAVVPPSGPRGAGPPTGPSPASRAPPPGPGFSGERGRSDKRFAGINNMLQQSGGPADRGPGPSVRGRGAARQAAGARGSSPQSSRPQTSGGQEDGSRSGLSAPSRPDLLASRTSGNAEEDGPPRSRLNPNARNETVDDSGSDSRRSMRYSSGASFSHDRDREHERERDRDRRGDEDDGTRSSGRRENGRDRNRERSRRSDAATGTSREERYESREASRRGVSSRDDNRRRRDRDDASEVNQEHEGRLRPPSSHSHGAQPPPPPPPPPPPAGSEDDRRWSGSGREGRDRERDRNRDRPRERNYHREGGSGGAPHRKRGRPGGDEGGPSEGSNRGGSRMGGESKRPRRGA